jgi:hypothetical protein
MTTSAWTRNVATLWFGVVGLSVFSAVACDRANQDRDATNVRARAARRVERAPGVSDERPAPVVDTLPPQAIELANALGARGTWQHPRVDAVPTSDTALYTLEDNSPAIGSNGRLVQTVGLEEMHATFSTTLAVGCAVPCWNAEVMSTGRDNASTIDVVLFRGTSSSDSSKIGEIEISGIAPAPRGVPEVVLGFGAVDRRLVLYARVRETRKPLAISRKSE